MKHRAIWVTAVVFAVVVLLAQLAGAATREDVSVTSSITAAGGLNNAVTTVSLPDQASAVAADKSANGIATANEAITTGGNANDETASNDVSVRGAAAAPLDASGGARPGWGCGDKNHTHSGPPGRPGATPPPGCSKP